MGADAGLEPDKCHLTRDARQVISSLQRPSLGRVSAICVVTEVHEFVSW